MNIEFKKMDYDDLESVISLCNLCFEENTSLEYAQRVFKENEGDKNQIYLIGTVDGVTVAHLKVNIVPTIYENMNTYAILNHVCVHPDYRRHHLGTQLLNEAFKICKEMNCKKVELWSMNFRTPAHSLYNNYGFKVEDAKFFAKELN